MKKFLFFCLMIICGLSLQACTPPYKIDSRASKNLDSPKPLLKSSDKILLVTPEDGKYRRNSYPKSGAAAADKLNIALRRYTKNVTLTGKHMTVAEAKTYASKRGFSHIFYPEITSWEDRVTAISGRRDRVVVHMTVYDVKSDRLVNDCLIYGNGSTNVWATAKTPEILLDKPFEVYAASLFGTDNGKK